LARTIVFGGHGKIALRLARLLTAGGGQVSAVIRNRDHEADVRAAGADPVLGDVQRLSTEQIAELVRGHDAVVWSAGAGGGNPARTYSVDRDAAIRSMDAAARAGVPRYVMVSYFGAGPDHGIALDNPFFHYAESKAAADAHLRSTELDWTVLGPSKLTEEPATGKIGVGTARSEVSRDNTAHVVRAVLSRPDTAGRTIEFNDGDTPIDQAL
jgi:uncharacterized protein YbjT (DUF2867 family)